VRLFLAFKGEGAVKSRIDPRVSNAPGPGKAKLLDRVREAIRLKHYSLRTEHAYIDWIKRFILFHGKQHPGMLGGEAVREFLSDLASSKNVAASRQNQAFSALLFLYREVLKQELPWIADIERAKRPPKIPVVFTPDEARAVLSKLQGTARLMAHLLYGSGLRLMARKSFARVPGNAMNGPCSMRTC
jgi:integrase